MCFENGPICASISSQESIYLKKKYLVVLLMIIHIYYGV